MIISSGGYIFGDIFYWEKIAYAVSKNVDTVGAGINPFNKRENKKYK